MRLASYNVLSGGFDQYSKDLEDSKRFDVLKQAVAKIQADFVGLIDTYRWEEIYTNKQIAEIFGYKQAYCINLNDDRLRRMGHNNGVTVLTNLEVVKYETIRIATRDAVRVGVRIGESQLEIFSVYLDDISEDTRILQVKELLTYLDLKIPSVVMGDLNTLKRRDLDQLDPVIEQFFFENPNFSRAYGGVINEMRRGEAIEILEKFGLRDVAQEVVATAPTRLFPAVVKEPVLRLDYAFCTNQITASNFEVVRGDLFDQASDHYPIVFDCQLV